MSKTFIITESEILNHPNYYELGEFIYSKYWESKYGDEVSKTSDENIEIHEYKKSPWICSFCNKDTSEIDGDYLSGYDHLSCKMNAEMDVEYDHCVICGKQSPYTRNTHIDRRIGYVEGLGQTCFTPLDCEK